MDEQFTEEDYKIMIENWISIEDDQEVLDAICEEEMEELENIIKPAPIDKADDDNETEPMCVKWMLMDLTLFPMWKQWR